MNFSFPQNHFRDFARVAVWLNFMVPACGTNHGETEVGDSSLEERLLCNGQPGIRMTVAALDAFDQLTPPPGWAFQDENGYSYFYLTGDCHFVVSGMRGRLEGDFQGVLDSTTAQALAKDLHFSSWSELGGHWFSDEVFDGGNWYFLDGENAPISCKGGCEGRGVPPRVPKMFQSAIAWRKQLYALGQPLDGPIRIVAQRDPHSKKFGDKTVEWPLSWPLDSIAVDQVHTPVFGISTLISDPEELRVLRDLWTWYRNEYQETLIPLRAMGVVEQDRLYSLYFRDALPVEDDRGLAPWSIVDAQ